MNFETGINFLSSVRAPTATASSVAAREGAPLQ